jgi:exopolyphosphatase / guanosine-5'-triphosphate,3'-diphosphate pyrophosphatase
MKLAAIDIGSNAARMQISSVLNNNGKIEFKKVEYIRYALRLGYDVFNNGSIGNQGEAKLKKLLFICKHLMELHEVEAHLICATSALRESENGPEIVERVKLELGMKINLISGEKEAEMINNVIVNELHVNKTYLHIDVGGGSTELNIYVKRKKIASESFKIGSVRLMEGKVNIDVWRKIQLWVNDNVPVKGEIIAVGTGGNISKLFEFVKKDENGIANYDDLVEGRKFLSKYTTLEKINSLKMNPDRADVIDYACEIYLNVMEWANANRMFVPDLGLKDGIILEIYNSLNKTA